MSARRLPSLHAIRAFEATARHLSMTRAAEELSLTPGAVSRHLRTLQEQLGETLILRESNGLKLTQAGIALADASKDGLDRIASAIAGLKIQRHHNLTICTYGYLASTLLIPNLAAFEAQVADVSLDIHTTLNPLDISLSKYDAVIAVTDNTKQPGLVTLPLLPISTLPVCAPSLLQKQKQDRGQDGGLDFNFARLLHSRARPDDWPRWLEHAKIKSIAAPQAGSAFESVGLAIQAATAGLGPAMAIEVLIQDAFQRGELVPAHSVVRPTRHSFTLMFDTRNAQNPALQQVKDWLVALSEEQLVQLS